MSESSFLVGIDPGLTGAVAILRDGRSYAVHDMPVVPKRNKKMEVSGAGLREILRELPVDKTVVFVELVTAMPSRQGQRGMGAASAFNFGKSAGVVRGVIEALGFRWYEITPAQWKRAAGLTGQEKDRARAVASGLFPTTNLRLKKHVAKAEALLIAHYGARVKGEAA